MRFFLSFLLLLPLAPCPRSFAAEPGAGTVKSAGAMGEPAKSAGAVAQPGIATVKSVGAMTEPGVGPVKNARPVAEIGVASVKNAGAVADPFADAAIAKLIRHGIDAERRCDVAEALRFFREADAARPDNAFVLQKISKQLSDSTDDLTDPQQQLAIAREALEYSRRAVALQPKSAVNLVSLAVCYGHIARWGSTRERVAASREVKKYTEEALSIDPNYAWAHHVLGRWNEEVAAVGAPTRAVARLLYGGLPDASTEEAIAHLKKAVELQPDQASHHIALGLVYWDSGDKKEGRAELEKGLNLPAREKHDLTLQAKARRRLEAEGGRRKAES